MSKISRQLQVTIPKLLATQYGLRPGDNIRFEAAGEVIRVVPPNAAMPTEGLDAATRLRLFDVATDRQRKREAGRKTRRASTRGWTRKELYERG